MIANYAPSLRCTLKWEGGYSNNPHDPGGATMRGVTKRVYDSFRRRNGLPVRDVRLITPLEIQAIYQPEYWDALGCSALPSGLDIVVFDAGVNSGVHRSLAWLKGSWGSRAGDPVASVQRFSAKRLSFLHGLRTWKVFGRGWAPRVAQMEATGVKWASRGRNNASAVLHRAAQEAHRKAAAHSGAATTTVGSSATIGYLPHIPWEVWFALGFVGLFALWIFTICYHIHTVRAKAFDDASACYKGNIQNVKN